MKLWKVDTKLWTVREVEAEGFPMKDSEGEIVCTNCHFEDKEEAWGELKSEAESLILIAARRLENAQEEVKLAQGYCGIAALAFSKVLENWPDFDV
jgi:hypothetical protein